MKKSIRLIAFLLVTVMLAAMIPVSASAVTLVKDMKIVCFGDSLTHYGQTNTGEKDEYGNVIFTETYPDHLATFTGAEVYNAGVGGNTTDMASLRIRNEVINQNPDAVVICLGMNDQAYNEGAESNMTSLEAYRANLERFAEMCQENGIDVIFLTPNPVYIPYNTPGADNYQYGDIGKYCNAMREVAVKYGCGLVDGFYEYSCLSNPADYSIPGDGVHQSALGREYFASLVAEYLAAEYENYKRAEMTVVCKDTAGKVLAEYTLVGMEGALVTVPSPDLGEGYTANTADVNTTFTNGATHTFTYTNNLSSAVTAAENATVDSALTSYVNGLITKGKSLLSASAPDFDAIGKCTVDLKNAVKDEVILSYGDTYTVPVSGYDSYLDLDDYGEKLTDGYKSFVKGWDSRYDAWNGGDQTLVLDLGEVQTANVFNAYAGACDGPGVTAPTGMTVSYSTDNVNWVNAGSAAKILVAANNGNDNGTWDRYCYSVTLPAAQQVRYVKFAINASWFLWVDEIEAVYSVSKANNLLAGATYTTSQLYRQGGSDTGWAWDENAEITYPDESGMSLFDGVLGSTSPYDEVWMGFHYKAPDYVNNGYHRVTIDLGGTKPVGVVSVYAGTDELGAGISCPATVEVLVSDNGTDFTTVRTVVPTFKSNVDGMYTEKIDIAVDTNTRYVEIRMVCGNWVFLSEVEMTKSDNIVEHSCVADGNGWYSDATSHWYECECGEVLEKAAHVGSWKTTVPAQVGVEGKREKRCLTCDYLLDTETLPALTEDHTCKADGNGWYSDDEGHYHMCTCGEEMDREGHNAGDWEPIDSSAEAIFCTECDFLMDMRTVQNGEAKGLRGDVNESGAIDARDYVLLKRAYFGTASLNEVATLLADVNNSGGLDARDYVTLKRAYFGTYEIPEDIKYVY